MLTSLREFSYTPFALEVYYMSHPKNFWVSADANESSEKRVARFKQWFNRSRIGDQVKEGRYNKKKLTPRLIRQAALKREEFRDAREKNKFYQ